MLPQRMSYIQSKRGNNESDTIGEPFKVMAISDTHLYADVDGNREAPGAYRESDKRYYYASGGKLRDFVSQVNAEKPDLVLHLGDMTELSKQNDFDLFNSIWSEIDSDIPRYLIPGNHDAYLGYNHMVNGLGVADRPTNAGSKFNYSFEINAKGISVKVILVDTNQDLNDQLYVTSSAVLSDIKKTWLKQEIEGAEAGQKVILCLHHGPHSRIFENRYFTIPYAQQYIDIINTAKIDKPSMHIFTLFGHSHPEKNILFEKVNVSTGINVAGALLNERAFYTELNLFKNSEFTELIDREINYPYAP